MTPRSVRPDRDVPALTLSRSLSTRLRTLAYSFFLVLPFTFLPQSVEAQDDSATPEELVAEALETRDDIAGFVNAFVVAVRHWDVDAWSEIVSPDIVMMAPNARMITGREAFHDLWSRTFEGRSGRNPLKLDVQEFKIRDDLAVVRLGYGPEEREPVGQYVRVLERKNSSSPWTLVWWIFNRRPPENG